MPPNRKACLEPGAGTITQTLSSDGLQMQHASNILVEKALLHGGLLPVIHLGNEDSTSVCPKTLCFFALKMKYGEKKGSAPPCLCSD